MVNVKTAMIHKDDGLAIRTSQRGDLDVDELTCSSPSPRLSGTCRQI